MSKQLAISSAFSIMMMATYVLFGAHAAPDPFAFEPAAITDSPVEISAPAMPEASTLLPSLR